MYMMHPNYIKKFLEKPPNEVAQEILSVQPIDTTVIKILHDLMVKHGDMIITVKTYKETRGIK